MNDGTALAKVLWYYGLCDQVTAGTQKIVCPFHADVNPSMVINFDEGKWFCFGCNASGDAARFVRLMEPSLGDLMAYQKYLQVLKSDKVSNVVVPRRTVKEVQATSRELYAQAYDYYHGLAKTRWGSDNTDEAIQALAYLEERGFDAKTLIKCGAKVNYNDHYGVIFPIMDNGKFRGWVCRTMIKEVEERRKYLYNTGFRRATTVVGDYGRHKVVYVVEGYMDRLKFIQHGGDDLDVVALFGWKASQQQIQKLKDAGITHIVSALDNDECGRKGTAYLRQFFPVTRWKYLRGIKDPGDMNRSNFRKMLKKTMEDETYGTVRPD